MDRIALSKWEVVEDHVNLRHVQGRVAEEEEGRGDLHHRLRRCSRCHPCGVSLGEWGVDVKVCEDSSRVKLRKTPRACRTWNVAEGPVVVEMLYE